MLNVTDIPVIVALAGIQLTFCVAIAVKFCVLVGLASGIGMFIGPELTVQVPGTAEELIKRTAGSPRHIATGLGVTNGGGGVAFTFTVAVLLQPVAVLVPVTVYVVYTVGDA